MSKEIKNGNGNGKHYPVEVWKKVEKEYEFGRDSIAELSRTYGPTRAAIFKHMEKFGIQRQLAADVHNAVQRKGIEAELHHTVTPENYEEAIEKYGELGAGMISHHKFLFDKIIQQVGATLDDLTHSQGIMAKLADGDRVKKVTVMAASLALKERNNLLRTVAHVMDKIVPLQRQAFNLDDSGSGAENITYYIVGDLEKPANAGIGKLKSA